MLFSIIISTIKLIINLIILGFGLLIKILKRAIFNIKCSKRKFFRFSYFCKLCKQSVKIIINIINYILLIIYNLYNYILLIIYNLYKLYIIRFFLKFLKFLKTLRSILFLPFTWFLPFIFLIIKINILILYHVYSMFIFLLNYFLFIFFKLLRHFIFTIIIMILRNSTGFFIIIKKPVEFLNIIIKSLHLFNIFQFILSFNEVIYNFIKTKYIILMRNFIFLKLLSISINILINLYNYVYSIFISFLKINLINLIKSIINTINNIINIIFNICRFSLNLVFIIPMIIYILFRYYSKKYFVLLFKFIFIILNNIKLIIIFTPKWLYYSLIWHLTNLFRIYINTMHCIYINTKKIRQIISRSIFIFFKTHYYKYTFFLKFFIKRCIFIIITYKLKFRSIYYIIINYCYCYKHILSFTTITRLLGYHSIIMMEYRALYLFLISNKYKIIFKNIICIFPCSISIILSMILKYYNSLIYFSIHILFRIFFKIKRRLRYIIRNTYLRISFWIRHKIMLFLTKRQQFYFKRYYIIRRARRRINIIRRYFRLQRRYLAWNIFQHSYSIIFLVIRNIMYFSFIFPIKCINNIVIIQYEIIFKIILFLISKPIFIGYNSILYSLINTVFNIIPFNIISFFIILIKKLIILNGIILNTVLIKLYNKIYINIIPIINTNIIIFVYLTQAIVLICNIICNNIIKILTMVYALTQFIFSRLLEICSIIYMIIYKVVYYLIYYPCFWVFYRIFLYIYFVYMICIMPIIIIKQILAIYYLILFIITSFSVIPFKHILKKVQKLMLYIYFQKQYDLVADKYALDYTKFVYTICYALTGLAFYGTIIYTVDFLIYCYKKRKKIMLIICFIPLIYIYNDEKIINEVWYCMTLTPGPLIDYLTDLSISLSNEFSLLYMESYTELKHKVVTIDFITIFHSFINFFITIFKSFINISYLSIKFIFHNIWPLNIIYDDLKDIGRDITYVYNYVYNYIFNILNPIYKIIYKISYHLIFNLTTVPDKMQFISDTALDIYLNEKEMLLNIKGRKKHSLLNCIEIMRLDKDSIRREFVLSYSEFITSLDLYPTLIYNHICSIDYIALLIYYLNEILLYIFYIIFYILLYIYYIIFYILLYIYDILLYILPDLKNILSDLNTILPDINTILLYLKNILIDLNIYLYLEIIYDYITTYVQLNILSYMVLIFKTYILKLIYIIKWTLFL